MKNYLHIGGGKYGLLYPVSDDAETVEWQVAITGRKVYTRSTLALDDVSITVYRHEDLPPERALKRQVGHYRAWAVNRPEGRR